MIQSIRHRGLKRLFERDDSRNVPAAVAERLRRVLGALQRAQEPDDLRLPGFGLHPLKGKRRGEWSITVTRNWRVTFKFEGTNVTDVNLEDYH